RDVVDADRAVEVIGRFCRPHDKGDRKRGWDRRCDIPEFPHATVSCFAFAVSRQPHHGSLVCRERTPRPRGDKKAPNGPWYAKFPEAERIPTEGVTFEKRKTFAAPRSAPLPWRAGVESRGRLRRRDRLLSQPLAPDEERHDGDHERHAEEEPRE